MGLVRASRRGVLERGEGGRREGSAQGPCDHHELRETGGPPVPGGFLNGQSPGLAATGSRAGSVRGAVSTLGVCRARGRTAAVGTHDPALAAPVSPLRACLLSPAAQSEASQGACPEDRNFSAEVEDLRRMFLRRPDCPQFCSRATSMSSYVRAAPGGPRENAPSLVGSGPSCSQPASEITVPSLHPGEGAGGKDRLPPLLPIVIHLPAPCSSRLIHQGSRRVGGGSGGGGGRFWKLQERAQDEPSPVKHRTEDVRPPDGPAGGLCPRPVWPTCSEDPGGRASGHRAQGVGEHRPGWAAPQARRTPRAMPS